MQIEVQGIIEAYKIVKGFQDDSGWDAMFFKRYIRDAYQLLEYLGSAETAIRCIEQVGLEVASFCPEWTLGTVIKRAAEWKRDEQERLRRLNAREKVLEMKQAQESKEQITPPGVAAERMKKILETLSGKMEMQA